MGSMTSEPATKRAKVGPDLKIVVDDGELEVYSSVLMQASAVFDNMLNGNFQEGSAKVIQLPGKKKQDLNTFWNALQLCTMEPLTPDRAGLLARWADEYQVGALTSKCDDYFVTSVPFDGPSLQKAIAYKLPRSTEQFLNIMKADVAKYLGQLELLAADGCEEHLSQVWPTLCDAACIKLFPMPPIAEVRSMWPFLAGAVRFTPMFRTFRDAKDAMNSWPNDLYHSLPRSFQAHVVGRDFLRAKLNDLWAALG